MSRRAEADRAETVLVTGAAGTVGAYVVRALAERGHRVVATDRAGSRFDFELPGGGPRSDAVEVRAGDLTDLSFCVDVLDGVGSIVHVAAVVDLNMPEPDMRRVNVDAVRFLYEAARARRCRRFVYFSSGSIYRKGSIAPITEDTPIEPRTAYERSKADAERYLLSMRDREPPGPEVVILRPTMIYGPRARFLGAKLALLPPLMALGLRRVPRLRGGAVCNWAHAEDVARAAALLLDEPRAAFGIFNVADDTPMAFGEVIETITRCYGLPLGSSVTLPDRVLAVVAPVLANHPSMLALASSGIARLWRVVRQRHGLVPAIDDALDRETFLYATTRAVFDTSRLRALGFEPRWRSLREGYPHVLRWFQAMRWLPVFEGATEEGGLSAEAAAAAANA